MTTILLYLLMQLNISTSGDSIPSSEISQNNIQCSTSDSDGGAGGWDDGH